MKTNVHHLVGWKLFCATCREREDGFCPAATRRQLNRFYARYRLAAHFEAVHAHGYSENALRGYTAGLRLLAAYSAAELLGEAIGSNVTSWKIPDPPWQQRCEKSCFDLLRIPQDCSHKKGCEKSSSCSWTVILISAFLPQLYASWWPTEVSRRQEQTP